MFSSFFFCSKVCGHCCASATPATTRRAGPTATASPPCQSMRANRHTSTGMQPPHDSLTCPPLFRICFKHTVYVDTIFETHCSFMIHDLRVMRQSKGYWLTTSCLANGNRVTPLSYALTYLK